MITGCTLLPKVKGVDMSFLPNGGVVDMPSLADDDSSSSAESTDDDDTSDSSDDDNQPDDDVPNAKRSRRVHQRRPMNQCAWWNYFLSPEAKKELLDEPDGKVAIQFRQAFRLPYLLFKVKIFEFAVRMWWPDWKEYKVDAFGRPVAYLELKLLGCLNVLGHGADHSSVSLQTNISEEVHRTFFVRWIGLMASVKEKFIYMPHEQLELDFVTDEYKAMGLPGCVGSVDCVHIGWDQCPVQCTSMYKGKEGYPSISYEVICTSRKFIQSVSAGHPGARNDKHIVRTDNSVMQLLDGNSWLNSRSWESMDPNGVRKVTKGLYLICDGVYHRWPCMMFPVKSGAAGSPSMKWGGMMESIRKDIECVFGSMKNRFSYLKKFNRMRKQIDIDNAFTTCCILHNILLEEDGWLEKDLPHFPNGVKDRLGKVFEDDPRGEAMTNRGVDTTIDLLMDAEEALRCCDETKRLAMEWQSVMEKLVDHYEFHSTK